MKKRVIAIVCTLALALGVFAAVLTIDVSATAQNFQVGYARVDINPWVDTKDHTQGLLQLPMQGNSDNMNRICTTELLDDNGDGNVGEGDGLFASCIAVTDSDGDTVLLYSVALVGANTNLVTATRKGLIDALKEQNIDIKLPAENIMIQGTHTHSSIALGEYKKAYEGSTESYQMKDQYNNLTEATITAGQVYNNFTKYYPYLLEQMVKAGVTAINDRATATMSKGEIKAGTAAAKTTAGKAIATGDTLTMNGVRHYTRVTKSGELYIHGSNFNGKRMDPNSAGDGTAAAVDSSGSAELVKANDTMYCLKFEFEEGSNKAPIALVNWRAHTTMVNRDGTKLYLSSDYINRMSYELSKQEYGSYRTIFIQGAAGNITTGSHLDDWCGGNANAGKDGIFTGNELPSNVYGEVLGQVAAQCLNNNMATVAAGDIRVSNIIFNPDAKSYKGNELAIRAGQTAKTTGVTDFPFVYPTGVSEKCYNKMSEKQQGWYKEYAKSEGWVENLSSTYEGENYIVASKQHVTDINQNATVTGTETLDLTAFMLGDEVAFVTAPGELFDRYNRNMTWDLLTENAKNEDGVVTQGGMFTYLNNSYNEWDDIVGETYGTPFVMGYANDAAGYFPNNVAYEYCKDSKVAAIGSYESHVTDLAQGEGEKILDAYADMLQYLVTGDENVNELYHTAECEVCGETVLWKGVTSVYNHPGGDPGFVSGHYYLTENVLSSQMKIADGATVCLDLNGYTLTGTTRAFLLDGTDETLNIMDSSEAKTGKMQGYGGAEKSSESPFGGGTIYIGGSSGSNCICNLYSGTLTQAYTETSGVSSGGVVTVRYSTSKFNMYGGTITGGKVEWTGLKDGTSVVNLCGGNVYVNGGTFNMYDGTISDGIAQAALGQAFDETGNVIATGNNSAYGGNVCVKSGSFNLYDGTISGGQSNNYSTGSGNIHGRAGNIYVYDDAHLNLQGGCVTGGNAGYMGNCVYAEENGNVTLSGDACVDQIYAYTMDTPKVTVSGLYTGTAQIRNRGVKASAAIGTVMGISDNAVLNTTGLTFWREVKTYTLVPSGNNIVIGSTATCACGETVVINELTQTLWDAYGGKLPSAHYKLSGDITAQLDPNGVELANDVCLDLAGHDISVTTGRLYKIASGGKLKIDDSVGDGRVITSGLPKGADSKKEGGLFVVCADAQLELYGGTLTMDANTTTNYTHRGGIIDVLGTVTIDGGNITGGKINNNSVSSTNAYGGNICIKKDGVVNLVSGSITGGESPNGAGNIQVFTGGTLNVSGGTISGGTATTGACVRLSDGGNAVLSGNGSVEQILLYAGDFTVSGTYTGTTVLHLANDTLTSGTVIGSAVNNANIDGADITIYDYPKFYLQIDGDQLVLLFSSVADIKDAQGEVIQSGVTVQTAINACQGTDKVVTLTQDTDVTGIKVTEALLLDLNGKQVTGQFTVSGDGKLLCMDTQTADYDADDENYTRLPATTATKAVAAPGYVKHTHTEDGSVSFHKIDTKMDDTVFSPTKAGMYYISLFMGDKYAAMEVDTFGVALSIQDSPATKDGIANHALHTTFDGSLFKPNTKTEFASTILTDVLNEKYSLFQNRKNGETVVYGCSYIQLKDGSYVFSAVAEDTLQRTVEYVNDYWDALTDKQKDAVLELFEKFPAVFRAWDTDVIEAEYKASK